MGMCRKACKYGDCGDFPLKGKDDFGVGIVGFEVSSIDGVWKLRKVLIFVGFLDLWKVKKW